ncbi:hypothetical protein ACSNOE_15600, partial [Streptomyces radiopugnans]
MLDVLHRDQVALRIHDGAFSAMDLTARHPSTGELLSTVKFMVQTLAAAGELQRDLQRELTYDGLRAAEAKGSKGGRRPAVTVDRTEAVRAAYLEGRSIAALARDHGVSRGAIRTAVADLLPDQAAIEENSPVPELPVTSTCRARSPTSSAAPNWTRRAGRARPGGDRTTWAGLHPARWRRPCRAPRTPRPLPAARRRPWRSGGSGTAQGPPRVREPRHRPRSPGLTEIITSALTAVPMFPEADPARRSPWRHVPTPIPSAPEGSLRLARHHGVSRGAIRTAVADLLPDQAA